MPGVAFDVPHARSCLRPNLCGETKRIGFIDLIRSKIRFQVILVNVPLPGTGNERFPDSSRTRLHPVGRWVPVIEVADDRSALRIRGPYGKLNALPPVPLRKMCAKFLIGAVEGAFRKQVPVEFA